METEKTIERGEACNQEILQEIQAQFSGEIYELILDLVKDPILSVEIYENAMNQLRKKDLSKIKQILAPWLATYFRNVCYRILRTQKSTFSKETCKDSRGSIQNRLTKILYGNTENTFSPMQVVREAKALLSKKIFRDHQALLAPAM